MKLAPKGITVNTVAPGPVNTDAVATVPDTHPLYQRLNSRQADKRYGEPKEIAEVVLFFASPMSSYVNGQILYVDGGIAGL
jgi:NAD(P)-dependent dehydrogenase (short-subunit alcohol dehydrogenase family)